MDLASGSSSRHLRTHLFFGRDSGGYAAGVLSSTAAVSSSSSSSNDALPVSLNKMSRPGSGRVVGRSQVAMGDKDLDVSRRCNNVNNNNMNNHHHNNNVNSANPCIQISCPISMNSPLINYKKFDHISIVDNNDEEDDEEDVDDVLLGLSDEYETPYDLALTGSRTFRGRSTQGTSGSSIYQHDAGRKRSSPASSSSSSAAAASSSSSFATAKRSSSSIVMTPLDFVGTSSNTHSHEAGQREFDLGSSSGSLQEDCFIIPAHRMSVFLPVPFLDCERRHLGSLNATHVDAPKISIIFHFAEPFQLSEPISTSPHQTQLNSLKHLLRGVKDLGSANDGMLLINLEKNSTYPFIVYLVVNTASVSVSAFLHHYDVLLEEEMHLDGLQSELGQGLNYIGGYEEVATIARPPIDIGPKTPSNPKTGYLITIFKVFPGEDREKLERSWLLWTGARVIYKHLPECLGMKRMTFHKTLRPNGGITYVLVCECNNLMEYVTVACDFVEHLRARCCGYTALYKNVEKF